MRLLAAGLIAALAPLLAAGEETPARTVLVLQSYQQGPEWVQSINDGVLSVFASAEDFRFNYRFEYMNILDADPSEYAKVYGLRLASKRFDVAIGIDNQALEFLVKNRSAFFAGVPIVFCSLDDFSPGMLKGETAITGVAEDLDIAGTIGLARRLHPGTKHLLVLANRDVGAESAAYADLIRILEDAKLDEQIEIEYWEDPKLSEIISRAGSFPADTVVFDMAFPADDAGKPLGLLSSTRKASAALGLPIYSCWETLLGNGIVGGMISGGYQQGETAGKLALEILRGADPDRLPVVRHGTGRATFDHAQLERFRVPERRLPPGSIVINRPQALYARYRGVIWAVVSVVVALVALLAVSWLYIVSQQRLKKFLSRSEERLSLALASTASGIWEYYPKTQKAFYDDRWFTMLGYEPGALPPEYRSWADLLHPDDRMGTEESIQRWVDEGKDFTVEFRLRGRDGRWIWISSSGKIVERDSLGSALRVVGTHVDISARKRAQEELESANLNLERRVNERTRELAALNELAGLVSRSLDLPDIMETALEKTMEAAGVESGAAYALDEQAGTLALMAHRGLSSPFVSFTSRLPLEAALAGKRLDAENPLVWRVDEYPEGELKRLIRQEGLELVIGIPMTAKGRIVGGLVVSTRYSRPLSVEERALLMAVGRQIGLAVENASLFEREKAKHEEAERRRTVAEALREILAVLNANRPLQETLDSIIRQTCRVTGSDGASLMERESAEGPFVIKSSCGMGDDCTSSVVFSVKKGGGGEPRQIFFARDLAAIPDQPEREGDPEYEESKRVRQCVLERGFRALLSVPLYVKDEEYGEITLYYRSPRDFSHEDVQLAVSVAGQAALAIENARLRSQAEQAAAFAERSRVARELHDSVTQSLYSITLYAEAVARMLASGAGSEAVKHLRELRATAQEALREMRLLIFQLSPPALETGGLAGALQIRLDAVESRGGVKAEMRVEGEENLDLRTRQELYQVAQEALNNALKHSGAQSVRVRLRFGDDETSLEISDDGCGFEPRESGGGLGMRSMRERVQQIGGALRVETSPGKGTAVRVLVPSKPATN